MRYINEICVHLDSIKIKDKREKEKVDKRQKLRLIFESFVKIEQVVVA